MNKRVLTIFGIVLIWFILFVISKERKFHDDSVSGLRNQVEVIAVNLWMFNVDATTLQIEFLSKLNDYRFAKITDFTGEPFAQSTPIELSGFSEFLSKIKLIRTEKFNSDITYGEKVIGSIEIEKYNLVIYDYLYLFSILLLFMILVIVLDRLDHINCNLEAIVAGKTETLKRSEESLQVTLNSIGEGLLAVDEHGLIVQLNAVAAKILGTTFEESYGTPLTHIIHTVDYDLSELFKAESRDKQICIGVIHMQNSEVTISATASPIIDNEGLRVGVVYVLSDITEKLRYEENLKHSQKMESIGRLAGGVAHDFNNMLGGILGAAELLKYDMPDEGHELITLITESAERAAGLTGKLLSFSRKGKVESSSIDVHAALSSAVSILSHSVSKKIQIVQDFSADESGVIGDLGQLQNCFLNLGINSSHAIAETGIIEFKTRTIIYTGTVLEQHQLDITPGTYVEIIVKDNGSGISEEHLNNIFEPFFTTKEQGKGTGLGLSAVHGTVLEHNGAITVESELGVGTSFHIFLPIAASADQREVAVQPRTFEERKGTTILVVDDEPVMRETARLHLQKAGFVVLTAVNGKDGVEKYTMNRDTIDLVIVDMIMPEMDGRDTFIALKEMNPVLPIILTSGFSRSGDFEDFRKMGFYDVLSKPYKITDLIQSCHEAMDS